VESSDVTTGILIPSFSNRTFLSEENKIMLIQALIMSLLNYLSSIWPGIVSKNLKIVEKVIRSLTRFTTSKRKYDSIHSSNDMQ
jgi:hypothetical protein